MPPRYAWLPRAFLGTVRAYEPGTYAVTLTPNERGHPLSFSKNLLLAALVIAPVAGSAEEAKSPAVTFSGMVDSYYTVNLTHGQDFTGPDFLTGPTGFNLNFAKLAVTAELEPVKLQLDLGFGPEGAAIGHVLVEQAFASMTFGKVTVDAGRFVTPAGFELFESKDNWLYTKGLLFCYAVTTGHEGVRVGVPLSDSLTLTAAVANGLDLYANDVGGAGSPYKTGMLTLGYSAGETTAAVTGFVAKDPATTEDAFLVDAVVTQGLGKLAVNVSGDFGGLGGSNWLGVGASAKYQVTDPVAAVARVEYLQDKDAIHTGLAPAESLISATIGASYAVGANASLRAEVRYDKADEKVFNGEDGTARATLAAIAWF